MVVLFLDLFIPNDIHLHPHKPSTSMAKMNLSSSDVTWTSELKFIHLILTSAFFLLFHFSFSDTPLQYLLIYLIEDSSPICQFSVRRSSHKQETLPNTKQLKLWKAMFLNLPWDYVISSDFSTWGLLGGVWEYGNCFGLSQRQRVHYWHLMDKLPRMLYILQILE